MLSVEEVTQTVKKASIHDLYLGLKLLEQMRNTGIDDKEATVVPDHYYKIGGTA